MFFKNFWELWSLHLLGHYLPWVEGNVAYAQSGIDFALLQCPPACFSRNSKEISSFGTFMSTVSFSLHNMRVLCQSPLPYHNSIAVPQICSWCLQVERQGVFLYLLVGKIPSSLLKKSFSGRAFKNFKGQARPGNHLFPDVQYITSKHKQVSAGQARSAVSLHARLSPAPICEAKSIRRPFVTSNRCRTTQQLEDWGALLERNRYCFGPVGCGRAGSFRKH